MIFGIVGNRHGWDYPTIEKELNYLIELKKGDIVISGGASGVDTYAQEYAKKHGAEMNILYPDPTEPIPKRYFDRNKIIAERCDMLIAFDRGSQRGSGTLNTINHAKKLDKPVMIVQRTNVKDYK